MFTWSAGGGNPPKQVTENCLLCANWIQNIAFCNLKYKKANFVVGCLSLGSAIKCVNGGSGKLKLLHIVSVGLLCGNRIGK